MKSIQIKDKIRKKNEKLKKIKLSTRNTNTSPDLSILHKPIDTSASDLYQVSQLLENGTDEVKSILSYECNIIYECRTCRSLFRSIINLISHKREYCKEKFDVTFEIYGKNMWDNCNSHKESVIHLCKTEQTISKDDTSVKNNRILRSQSKEASKKDLSTIVDMLKKKRKEENEESNFSNEIDVNNTISSTPKNSHIYLEPINTNCFAMYQTVKSSNAVDNTVDLMKVQVAELQNIKENKKVTLDGQILENQAERSNSPVPMNMSNDNKLLLTHKLPSNNLSCTICKAKFATKKTLYVHMKVLHTPHRKYYLCPCCTSTFANTWSVYRHLYKVHRKTNEQVRKLRLQIQQVMDTEIISGNSRNTRTSKASVCKKATMKKCDISQGSVDQVESNVIGSKRRKKVNKKKAFSTNYQTSITERDDITINSSQSSETSSDSTSSILCKTEDTNAIIDIIIESPSKTDILDAKSDKYTSSSSENVEETSICVQDCYSLKRENYDMLEDSWSLECNSMHNNNDPSTIKSSMKQDINKESLLAVKDENCLMPDKDLQLPFVEDIKEENIKLSSQYDEKQLTDVKEKNIKNPLLLIQEKIAKIANFEKVRCLLCKRKFTSISNLRRHTAMHIGWNRYRCKLCEYKCFTKCDCVLHCNKVHNAQNNRKMLTEIVIEIPSNEYTCDENMINEINIEEKVNDCDDITKSTDQSEIHANLDNLDDSDTCYSTLENKIIANEQVVELQGTVEHQNVEDVNVKDDSTTVTENWTEYIMNDQSEKLNPDLKRMIMEVIFGSTDTSATKQTDTDKVVLETSNNAREQVNANDDKNSGVSIDNSKEPSCSILDTLKHQRPMRNRIRPLNNDFIYDLEEVASRKESALSHDSETLRKKAKLHVQISKR